MQPPTPKKLTKTDFVRGLPDLSADEVIKKGKEAGFTLSRGYVYAIRARSRAVSGTVVPRNADTATASEHEAVNGLQAEIERITEAKLEEMLTQRLGAFFER
jgi:hypothetical protein